MVPQTAHDQGYIVKHLLSGLPNVTDRVRAMRAGRPHVNAEERKHEMMASQEAYIKARAPFLAPLKTLWPSARQEAYIKARAPAWAVCTS